jgi:hypothetical protein
MVMATRFYAIPPAVRYVVYLGWRAAMTAAYNAHKRIVILRECAHQAVDARFHGKAVFRLFLRDFS